MTKQELIDTLNNWYYQPTGLAVVIKLLEATPDCDPDLEMALEDGVADQIISFYFEVYDTESLFEFLDKTGGDLFQDYRYADIYRVSDYDNFEDFKENSGLFSCSDNPDCLFYNEETGVYVRSW